MHMKSHIYRRKHVCLFNLLDKQWLGKCHKICDSFESGSDSNVMTPERAVGSGEGKGRLNNLIQGAFVVFAHLTGKCCCDGSITMDIWAGLNPAVQRKAVTTCPPANTPAHPCACQEARTRPPGGYLLPRVGCSSGSDLVRGADTHLLRKLGSLRRDATVLCSKLLSKSGFVGVYTF